LQGLTYAVRARPGDEPDTKVWAVQTGEKWDGTPNTQNNGNRYPVAGVFLLGRLGRRSRTGGWQAKVIKRREEKERENY